MCDDSEGTMYMCLTMTLTQAKLVVLRLVEDDRNSSTNRKNFRVKSNRSQSKGKIEVSQSIVV